MPKTSPLRARVQAGERLFGSFVFLSSATVVEILGRAGLDFVILDQEHSPKSWETLENMVRAAELTGTSPLVRVARVDDKEILHALELGAQGIVLPFVESGADVQRAASAMRYPPAGVRGTCTQTRVAGFGALRARFAEIAQQSNENLLLVGLIESRAGVDNIAEILSVDPGLDVVIVGRSDLATDLGRPGQANDAIVENATRQVIDAVRASPHAKRQSGLAVYSAADCERWSTLGCRFFVYPSDANLLFDAAATLSKDVADRCDRITRDTSPMR